MGDVEKGTIWPQTRIPRNPFGPTDIHAAEAFIVLKKMMDELLLLFQGVFDDAWFWQLHVKNPTGTTEQLSMDSLFNGFRPGNYGS